MNLISKLSNELERKTDAVEDMKEEIAKLKEKLGKAKKKINKLENKVSLEQRYNRMLKARMLETTWSRKLEHFRQRTRNLRSRWKTCRTDLDNEKLKNLELTKKLQDSDDLRSKALKGFQSGDHWHYGETMMMLANAYEAGFDDLDPDEEIQSEPSRIKRICDFLHGYSKRSPNPAFYKGRKSSKDDFIHEFVSGQNVFLKDDEEFAVVVGETQDEVKILSYGDDFPIMKSKALCTPQCEVK